MVNRANYNSEWLPLTRHRHLKAKYAKFQQKKTKTLLFRLNKKREKKKDTVFNCNDNNNINNKINKHNDKTDKKT